VTGDGRPASVVHEWVNRLRHEVYVARSRDVAAVARVGFMMATFANPDGTSITCGQERLAILTGSSQETVSRAIKVLLAVELVRAQRRPNRNAEYRLQPLMHGNRVDWATHMHLYTDTRQRRRKAAQKEAEIEALLNPEPVAERSPSETVEPVPGGVPEPVPGGGTNSPVTKLEPVPERGRNPFRNGFRNPFPAGGTSTYLPPVVTSTEDQDTPPVLHQPQQGGGGRPVKIDQRMAGECEVKSCICGATISPLSDRSVCLGCAPKGS